MGVGKQKRRDKRAWVWEKGGRDSTGQLSGAEGKASGIVGGGRELGGKEGPVVPS